MPTYGGQTAFSWADPVSSAHGMMFSILPTNPTDTTGLAVSKTIDFTVSSVPFATLDEAGLPVQPAAATAPDGAAKHGLLLSGAVLGMTAVAASLL